MRQDGTAARRIGAGALATLAGAGLLVAALLPEPAPPPPDPAAAAASARAAKVERLAGVWHSVPVERLFPAELRAIADDPPMVFTRLGVAPEAGCREVLDPAVLAAVAAPCSRVLRATYLDATRTVVATTGIVVLGRPPPILELISGLDSGDVLAMRAFAVPETEAGRFRDRQRISSGAAVVAREPDAPYLLTVVVGASDGRTPARLPTGFDRERHRELDRAEWRLLGDGLLIALKDAFYEVLQASTASGAAAAGAGAGG